MQRNEPAAERRRIGNTITWSHLLWDLPGQLKITGRCETRTPLGVLRQPESAPRHGSAYLSRISGYSYAAWLRETVI